MNALLDAPLNPVVALGENVLAVSGGKDSTAMYCLAVQNLGDGFKAYFADTGNEHPITIEYVETLHEQIGGPKIETIKADLSDRFPVRRRNIETKWRRDGVPESVIESALEVMQPTGIPFLDSVLLHGVFPSRLMQFCTEELKIEPAWEQVYAPIWAEKKRVIAWQGVRRDESNKRADLPELQKFDPPQSVRGKMLPPVRNTAIYRPMLDWTVEDVWEMHDRHNVRQNPLYRLGFKRVGCFPCIHERKHSLRLIVEKHPEHKERIKLWEETLNRARFKSASTFFHVSRFMGAASKTTENINAADHGIDAAAKWATGGGKWNSSRLPRWTTSTTWTRRRSAMYGTSAKPRAVDVLYCPCS